MVSMCHIYFCYSKWCSNIVLSDVLESNRQEIERFWKQEDGAFNWEHYFRFIGVLELNPDIKSIEERTRKAIKAVYYCDITKGKREDIFLVTDIRSFDLIIARYEIFSFYVNDVYIRSLLLLLL